MRVRVRALAIPWDHGDSRGGVRGLHLCHGKRPDHATHGGGNAGSSARLPPRCQTQYLDGPLDWMAFGPSSAGGGSLCRRELHSPAVMALGLVAGYAAGLQDTAAPAHASLRVRLAAGGAPVAPSGRT